MSGLVALLLLGAAADGGLDSWPSDPRPGDLVWLRLAGASSTVAVDVLGHRFVLWPGPDGAEGPVALPIEAAPGATPVFVDEQVVGHIQVQERAFRETKLSVAPKFTDRTPPPARLRRIERERLAMAAVWARPPTGPATKTRAVPPVQSPVRTSPYGVARTFNGEVKSRHYGLDLRGKVGDPVFAVLPGRVALSSDRFYSGQTVVIDHGGGLFSLSFHLSRRDVNAGERVEAGQRIGAIGKSGRVTGPHLHLGIAVQAEPSSGGPRRGLYVDPEPLLSAEVHSSGL